MEDGSDNMNLLANACVAADELFGKICDVAGTPYAVKAFSIVLGAQAAYQDNPKGAVSTVETYIKEAMEKQYRERVKEEKSNKASSTTKSPGARVVSIGGAKRPGAVSGVDARGKTKK